ncbi:DNA methylase [Streptococcus infantarius subsp. infantarius]|nr:DNA methylase [Streptococcus infantarius subsp. infantarius]
MRWFLRNDKFARKSYKAIYDTEGENELHDIAQVTNEGWRKFRGTVDIICGGFPCQAFSIAGKREGFLDETRGTLFFEIARAAKEIKPSLLFLENVKGLLSHNQGRTFRKILSTLDELGYDAEWQILNSKDYGVPQNRERVYIIGHLRGECRRQVFPIFGKNGTTNQANIKQIGNINNSTSFGGNPQAGRVYDVNGISPTLNTMQGGGREPKVVVREATNFRIRKLTPRECWRLQGFPDWAFDKAQEVNSNSQLYKQAGNSVTVNVIKAISGRLKK